MGFEPVGVTARPLSVELSDGALRLENVTVGETAVSLAALPGRVTALTGPGTAALLSVALGLVRPDAGRVTVGGVDLDELDPAAWWTRVAWVPQRPALVVATVADNIRLGWSASDAEVAAAADAAGVGEALDSVLLEDGLPDAARQRIGLARAFLRDADVVLLDEPTEALEQDEAPMLASLRRLVAGRTVLMAAHRPALLALADDVVAVPALLTV